MILSLIVIYLTIGMIIVGFEMFDTIDMLDDTTETLILYILTSVMIVLTWPDYLIRYFEVD